MVGFCSLAVAGAAQAQKPLPANYIQVSASFAQKLVVAEMKEHSGQIQKIGLHAVPSDVTANAIIACDIPSKIDKKSSAPDLAVIAAGKPHVTPDLKGHFYDLAFPIADKKGRSIGGGLLVMEVPFADVSSVDEALKIG